MSPLRLIILVVAAAAAIGAVFLVKSMQQPTQAVAAVAPPVAVVAEAPKVVAAPMVKVLIAKRDLPMGQYLTLEDLAWQDWPEEAPIEQFMVEKNAPDALEKSVGAVVRVPMVAGEPIVAGKIIQPGTQGFMAAILSPGMRAVSIEISAETAAGGFILPNDRVDILMTRDLKAPPGSPADKVSLSQRVLANIRVLAIDAIYGVPQEGQGQVIVGTRATLELNEADARLLSTSHSAGKLSLTLRSVADLKERSGGTTGAGGVDNAARTGANVRIYRYGQEGVVQAPAP